MFTGIIEELGTLESFHSQPTGIRLRARASTVLTDVDLQPGSFAADLPPGTRTRASTVLTAVDLQPGSFAAEAWPFRPAH